VKIRVILVQTKRSPKKSFGAALHTMPFDRVNGLNKLEVIDFCALNVHQYAIATFTSYSFVSSMELGPRSPRNEFGAARNTIPFDRVSSDV
jgi:hypothetical protein